MFNLWHYVDSLLPYICKQLGYINAIPSSIIVSARNRQYHIVTLSFQNNKGIIPKVKLVPEAKPRDTNNQVVLFPLSILGSKHFMMAQCMSESPNILIYQFLHQ